VKKLEGGRLRKSKFGDGGGGEKGKKIWGILSDRRGRLEGGENPVDHKKKTQQRRGKKIYENESPQKT